jgi:hypothetical protein
MAAKLKRTTHKVAIHQHQVAESCTVFKFLLQAVSPETSGYTQYTTSLRKTYYFPLLTLTQKKKKNSEIKDPLEATEEGSQT